MLALSPNVSGMFDMPVSSKMSLATTQPPYTPHVHKSLRGYSQGSIFCYCAALARPRVGSYGKHAFPLQSRAYLLVFRLGSAWEGREGHVNMFGVSSTRVGTALMGEKVKGRGKVKRQGGKYVRVREA
jgi:hypothetical protein